MNSGFSNKNNQLRVLVLGGTGSIGSAVARTLANRGHQVTCLARSLKSEQALREANYGILSGDIRTPEKWIKQAADFDAVIQAAATWADDMDKVDSHLTSLLLKTLTTTEISKTLIYTGGCWLYGECANNIATEQSPYSPIADFTWAVNTCNQVVNHPQVRGIVIHPAMVYERNGGVLDHMISDANELGRIRVIGSADTHWTMIHHADLAEIYALVLENGKSGEAYNAAGIEAIKVIYLAQTLTQRFSLSAGPQIVPLDEAVSKLGSWVTGYGLDQKMSSKKVQVELGWIAKHTDVLSDIG